MCSSHILMQLLNDCLNIFEYHVILRDMNLLIFCVCVCVCVCACVCVRACACVYIYIYIYIYIHTVFRALIYRMVINLFRKLYQLITFGSKVKNLLYKNMLYNESINIRLT